MRKVVHFEIPADDLGRARDFYGSVFGWDMQSVPMAGRRPPRARAPVLPQP